MIPSATQLITVVILLVPGFISIQVLSLLCPTRRLAIFDATVTSIIFSLLIHGTFTLGFIHLHTDAFNDLIQYIGSSKWPTGLYSSLILYLSGLLIYSIIIGMILSFLKNKGRFHKFIHHIGFNYSEHENLWDEMMYLYSIKGETPILIIHFEKESYAGWVYRASFDLEKNERKEIILSNPRYKVSDGGWGIMQNDLLYLDLSDVSSIEYIGSKHLLNSKY
jgi:Family of unknown function (DUF6338)